MFDLFVLYFTFSRNMPITPVDAEITDVAITFDVDFVLEHALLFRYYRTINRTDAIIVQSH